MRIGAVFPQTEIGTDPVAIRDFGQAIEGLDYEQVVIYDHVLGANAGSRPGWDGWYDHRDLFHEPFVLFGYLAAFTERLELATGTIILPQRQTTLVAKQAAEVDVLSGGRLRLGVAVGWNQVEFEGLGENFRDRGRRIEEQVQLLRLLWTHELVTFDGRWHKITDAGINPLPVQRPIPVWFGGGADAVLRRIARMGDGWLASESAGDLATIETLRAYAREIGRDPATIGVSKTIALAGRTPEDVAAEALAWTAAGATNLAVDTMGAGFATLDAHIDAIRQFKDTVAGL